MKRHGEMNILEKAEYTTTTHYVERQPVRAKQMIGKGHARNHAERMRE